MSLNHILDTARKLGIPVVITNERGESPQVVMPFEDFASMVGVSRPGAGKPRITDRMEIEEERDEIAQALADLTMERFDEQADEPIPSMDEGQEEEPGAAEEGFLEDNFYFEPLEDKESL
jgi:hypothetical protein